MSQTDSFEIKDFIPYLLNHAADVSSREFERYYKSRYGMLRTEWRVVFHLGRYEKMTAKAICEQARIHKTKVSRAVQALEDKKFLKRTQMPDDRRHEILQLTPLGKKVFKDLCVEADRFETNLMATFSDRDRDKLRQMLTKIAKL